MKRFKKYIIALVVCLLAVAGVAYYMLGRSVSNSNEKEYIYIDSDDNVDSVLTKVSAISSSSKVSSLKMLVSNSSYADHIKTGRYCIKPSDGIYKVFVNLKSGNQTPVNLTIPSVRTIERMSKDVTKKLLIDSTDVVKALQDSATCKKYGFTTETIACMFIPNTYDIFWNTSVEKLLDRMEKEYKKFWNDERTAKAKNLGLTPVEVSILASIVDEETANNGEKPMIAGLYYNRVKKNMLLQADPTVKFALKNFEARRVLNSMLSYDSPYNTYKYQGLPPGPIRVPSVAGIEAVLDMVHHDYLYMCAKEDFSGTHNFAKTLAEHEANAQKYRQALDQRGIKK